MTNEERLIEEYINSVREEFNKYKKTLDVESIELCENHLENLFNEKISNFCKKCAEVIEKLDEFKIFHVQMSEEDNELRICFRWNCVKCGNKNDKIKIGIDKDYNLTAICAKCRLGGTRVYKENEDLNKEVKKRIYNAVAEEIKKIQNENNGLFVSSIIEQIGYDGCENEFKYGNIYVDISKIEKD